MGIVNTFLSRERIMRGQDNEFGKLEERFLSSWDKESNNSIFDLIAKHPLASELEKESSIKSCPACSEEMDFLGFLWGKQRVYSLEQAISAWIDEEFQPLCCKCKGKM